MGHGLSLQALPFEGATPKSKVAENWPLLCNEKLIIQTKKVVGSHNFSTSPQFYESHARDILVYL